MSTDRRQPTLDADIRMEKKRTTHTSDRSQVTTSKRKRETEKSTEKVTVFTVCEWPGRRSCQKEREFRIFRDAASRRGQSTFVIIGGSSSSTCNYDLWPGPIDSSPPKIDWNVSTGRRSHASRKHFILQTILMPAHYNAFRPNDDNNLTTFLHRIVVALHSLGWCRCAALLLLLLKKNVSHT